MGCKTYAKSSGKGEAIARKSWEDMLWSLLVAPGGRRISADYGQQAGELSA